MIRPGKRYLVGKDWKDIEKEVWIKTDDYFFKQSHAMGYALAIIVQLNSILENQIDCQNIHFYNYLVNSTHY